MNLRASAFGSSGLWVGAVYRGRGRKVLWFCEQRHTTRETAIRCALRVLALFDEPTKSGRQEK